MTVEAAAVIAQVLPALLVIGLLVPLLSGMSMQWPERGFFRNNVILVLVVEAICLWSVLNDKPLYENLIYLFYFAILYSLGGIWLVVSVWARRSKTENEELGKYNAKSRERWKMRRSRWKSKLSSLKRKR